MLVTEIVVLVALPVFGACRCSAPIAVGSGGFGQFLMCCRLCSHPAQSMAGAELLLSLAASVSALC